MEEEPLLQHRDGGHLSTAKAATAAAEEALRPMGEEIQIQKDKEQEEVGNPFMNLDGKEEEEDGQLLNEDTEDLKPNARMRFSVFNLANTIIGGGILSLPFSFKLLGLGFGLVCLCIIYCLGLFSMHLLILTAELTGMSTNATFREVGRRCFGKIGQILSDICIILSCLGLMCSYFIIVVDMIAPLIEENSDLESFHIRIMIIMLSLIVLIPLSSLRHINILRFTSVIAVIAVAYFLSIVIYRSIEGMVLGELKECETSSAGCVKWFILTTDFLTAIPIISLAFTCQMNIFTIYSELFNSNPKRMGKVSFRAMSVCLCIFSLISGFGYVSFRSETLGNIMLNYDVKDPLIIVARIAIGIEILFSYPVLAHPCISTFDKMVFPKGKFSYKRKIPEAIGFCVLGAIVAIFVEDISFIFALIGATTCNGISFILPPAFYLKVTSKKYLKSTNAILEEKKTNVLRYCSIALFITGCFFLVSSTIVTILQY